MKNFSLKPFPAAGALPGIAITGTAERRSNSFSIRYALSGRLSDIVIPAPGDPPKRMDRLWEETCLELFLGPKHSELYWEFNLSPSGHWNVYRFTSYRQGMKEEPAFRSLPFSVQAAPDALRVSLEFGSAGMFPPDQVLEVAATAVIRGAGGGTTYWALIHCGPEPDFHLRNSLIIEL